MSSGGNKNYNEIENFTIFRKPTIWINFEGTILNAKYFLKPRFMYFCKINNEACREAITGKIFYLTEDNHLYNEETGLYFNADNVSQVTLEGFNKMCDDSEYISEVNNSFDYYKKVKNLDNEKRDKAEYMLLKKGIEFRK